MITLRLRFLSVAFLAVLALALSTGCRRPDPDGPAKVAGTDQPFELGDRIENEGFVLPTLEELDASVEWIPNEVADTLELRRQYLQENPPQATVEEALALRNTSPEENALILSAMGRLPTSDDEVDWNATFNRHLSADAKSLNPLFMSSTAEFEVQGLLGIGLVDFDWNFETYGSAATVVSWETSSDGLVDKFILRDDLYWSDGEPVTAHDFAFTFKVVMSNGVPVTSRTSEERLNWVEAYDDQTLVIFHKEALATNRWNCSLSVIPEHVFKDTIAADPTLQNTAPHVAYEQNPVVAGPYGVVRREKATEIVLERREAYYLNKDGATVRNRPYFQKVVFMTIEDPNTALLALKAGDIEDLMLTADQWISQTSDNEFYADNTKVYATEWAASNITWNIRTLYFEDPRVRWAMTYAFDHEEMLDTIYFDLYEPCTGVFHPTSKWAPVPSPDPVKRDLGRAEELLAEAGWEDHDGDGILDKEFDGEYLPFEFTILTTQRPSALAVCALLKQNLEDIGIICNISPTEFTVMQQKNHDHQFEASLGGWGTGTDPFTLENLFVTDQDRNFSQYSNEEVDELFVAGRSELDPEKRVEIYRQIHMLLWEDQPFTWLANPATFYGFNRDLRGYAFSPRGPYSYGPGFFSIWKPKQ